MGLLEKAQQKRQYTEEESPTETNGETTSSQQSPSIAPQSAHQEPEITTTIEALPTNEFTASDELVEIVDDRKKPRLKRKKIQTSEEQHDELSSWGDTHSIIYLLFKRKKVIEEQTGFGYNGLGTRSIVFDYDTKEYVYEVSEPYLTQYEKDVKKELSHLFKMLADVNITDMDEEDKKRYLEETLEQIIIDNDIKFYRKPKPKKAKKGFFSFGSIKDKDPKVKKKQAQTSKPQKKVDKKNVDQKKHFFTKKKIAGSTKSQPTLDGPESKQTPSKPQPEPTSTSQEDSTTNTPITLSIKEEH